MGHRDEWCGEKGGGGGGAGRGGGGPGPGLGVGSLSSGQSGRETEEGQQIIDFSDADLTDS